MLEIVKSFLSPTESPQSGILPGQYYERRGACNRCGKCCSDIYLVFGQQTINSLEMFEDIQRTNPEYQYFRPQLNESDENGLLFQCMHLQPDNTCGVYDQRPSFCRKYPSEHSLLMGGKLATGCGYQFRLLKTFQDVLRGLSNAPAKLPQSPSNRTENHSVASAGQEFLPEKS